MGLTYLAPTWFYGWDVLLEIIFAIVTLLVSYFAFRIYKSTSRYQVKLLGMSFAFISVSYFVQSVFNFLIITRLNENVCKVAKIQSVVLFDTLGLYAHVFFMLLGLSVLTYMTLKIENLTILFTLTLLSFVGVYFSINLIHIYFIISSIYLAIITLHFIKNYLKNKNKMTLLVAIAFLFLFFGSFHFLISVNHSLFYVIGHILELFAYSFILANLLMVLKR